MANVKFIFVGGQSGAGKSTFAKVLSEYVVSQHLRCAVISTDNYFREIPEGMDLVRYQQETNFDLPEHQDFNLLLQHIAALNQRQGIERPVFDFTTSKRKVDTIAVPPSDFVIIEGIFVLHFLNEYILSSDLNIHYVPVLIQNESWIDTVELRIERSKKLGFDEAWLRKQESTNVGPGYLRYTLSRTPGLVSIDNPSVNPAIIMDHVIFPDLERSSRKAVPPLPRIKPFPIPDLRLCEEKFREQIARECRNPEIQIHDPSRPAVKLPDARRIIAASQRQYDGTQIRFFPNRLLQSYGPFLDDTDADVAVARVI